MKPSVHVGAIVRKATRRGAIPSAAIGTVVEMLVKDGKEWAKVASGKSHTTFSTWPVNLLEIWTEIRSLDCVSLEEWEPKKTQAIRTVEVLEHYTTDGSPRITVRILEGPERGRIVTGLCPNNLIKEEK